MPFIMLITIPIRHIDIINTVLVCKDVKINARIIPINKIIGRKKVNVPSPSTKVMMVLQITTKAASIVQATINLCWQQFANPEINCRIISSVKALEHTVESHAGT